MSKHNRRRQPEMSHHHKLANSRGGAPDLPNNELIQDSVHKAIHRIFENEYTLEKIKTIVTMDDLILTDFFKRAIMDVLNLDYKDVVIQSAFRNNKAYNLFPETKAHNNLSKKNRK